MFVSYLFLFGFLVFALVHLRDASLFSTGQMWFCQVKRKWRLKPARFFVAWEFARAVGLLRQGTVQASETAVQSCSRSQ